MGHGETIQRLSSPKRIEALTEMTSVVAGWEFSVALGRDTLFLWGSNKHGQLGCPGSPRAFSPLELRLPNVQTVSCGWHHVIALDTHQRIWTWGKGEEGQLGHGSFHSESQPRLLQSLYTVKMIACGSLHTLVG